MVARVANASAALPEIAIPPRAKLPELGMDTTGVVHYRIDAQYQR